MDLQQLDTARRVAHAAWVAAGSPDKGEVRDALDVAARAYAAAKRSAASTAGTDASARIDAVLAAREARKADADRAARNLAIIRRAFAYPRCGQGFPATSVERAAQSWAVATHGDLDSALAAHEVYS